MLSEVKNEAEAAPLGSWIWSMAQKKGYGTKSDLILALKVPAPTFYAWASTKKYAVPKRQYQTRLKDVLKLTIDQTQELDEVLTEQDRLRQVLEASMTNAETASIAEPAPAPQSRPSTWIELDDPYHERPAALELLGGKVDPATIAALSKLRNKAYESRSVDDWYREGLRLQALRDGKVQSTPEAGAPADPDLSPSGLAARRAKKH